MSATATSIINADLDRHPVQVLVGLHEERPCPGAVAYQTVAALTSSSIYRNPRLEAESQRLRSRRSVSLVLTEAPRQDDADTAHLRLLESAAPLLALGSAGLPAATEAVRAGAVPGGHQVLIWSDGIRARLLFQGDHRIILVRAAQASLIRPSEPGGIGHCELALAAGDILVMVAHATHGQLPLGTVADMAREEPTPQALCQRATRLAAASDPLSHHAAVAMSVTAAAPAQPGPAVPGA